MRQRPVVRLHLFFATENETAVILRQGPTEVFRLIRWNRSDDTFEDGQWLKQKVYVDACDLSPDGRHFLYFTLGGDWGGPSKGAYTVFSQVPYFTALGLFPDGSTWGGGGRFLSNTAFVADGADDIVGHLGSLKRLKRVDREQSPSGFVEMSGKRAWPHAGQVERADPARQAASRGVALDRYDTQGGVLSRRKGLDLIPIRDFTEMSFEPVKAPYDTRADDEPPGDAKASWHPLDAEDAQ